MQKLSGSLSNSPEGTSLDPAGIGSDIGADRQLVDYDSDSPDELNKEMSSPTLEGNMILILSFDFIVYLLRIQI